MKTLRKRLKLTQAAAARLVGVTVTTWCRWETGKNTPQGVYADRIEMLEYAATTPCNLSRGFVFDAATPMEHVRDCPQCRFSFLIWCEKVKHV